MPLHRLSVLKKADCNPHYQNFEFNRQGLSEALEVDSLYATYAHDPKTADEPPRGILQEADLIKLSIKDEGRDVRSGVIVKSQSQATTSAFGGAFDEDTLVLATEVIPDDGNTPAPADESMTLGEIVASAIDGYTFDPDAPGDSNVPEVATDFEFERTDGTDSTTNAIEITTSGIVELVFNINAVGDSGTEDVDEFNPIARGKDRGEMRFFGFVENSIAGNDYESIPYGPLDNFLVWDEDVISGTEDQAPAISLQANLRAGDTVTLSAIHYLTSEVEYIKGGELCLPIGFETPAEDVAATTAIDETSLENKGAQAACTDDELGDDAEDYEDFKLDVSSDGVQTARNLYLRETGRFTGVFQGFIRLTDADGDGGEVGTNGERVADAARINWGLEVMHAPDPADHDAELTTENAAVIGVDNGPVRIAYKDTDGSTRSFTITVDIGPPTIDVTAPTHDGRSDDEEINFSGTINDGESGLAVDTFALYIDHRDDQENQHPVLDISVEGGTGSVGNVTVGGTNTLIETATQYSGYAPDTQETFGIIDVGKIYPDPGSGNPGVTDDDKLTVTKGIDAEDFADGDANAAFRDSIRVNFLENDDTTDYNHPVDFQAVVRDTAGNIGFSDSDEVNPRYINDLGTEVADREVPNVLGVYSRHIVYIDNVDPVIDDEKTVTGFFDVDSDKDPVVDRSGVMVVFDGPVDARGIDVNTFVLTMGEGENKETLDVIDTKVSASSYSSSSPPNWHPTLPPR